MGTTVAVVPVGTPQVFAVNLPAGYGCILAQPGVGGTVALDYSVDGINWTPDLRGASAVAICAGQSSFGMGLASRVRVTAAVAPGVAVAMDMNPRNIVIAQSTQPITTQAVATEGAIFAMRLPAGLLRPGFMLDIDATFSGVNNANVKTIRAYLGNVGAVAGGALGAGVLTSLAGGRFVFGIGGRSDGASIYGVGGYGGLTSGPVQVSTNVTFAGPLAQEQELSITCQKATAGDSVVLEAIAVKLSQGQLP